MIEESVKIASQWWADALSNFKKNKIELNPNSVYEVAIEDGDIEKFKNSLYETILNEYREKNYLCPLGCDYGPDQIIFKAIKKARLNNNLIMGLPWKTVMWITSNEVRIRKGYRGVVETLYNENG